MQSKLTKPRVETRYQFSVHSEKKTRSLLAGGDLHLGGSALVTEELRVHTSGGNVSLSGRLLDAVSVLLAGLVMCGVVLRFCHITTSAI